MFDRLFEYAGVNEQGHPEYRHRQTGIVMVRVPGGTFLMGTSEEDVERLARGDTGGFRAIIETEEPQHEVTISPFLIAKYEVTQAEWRGIMGGIFLLEWDSLPVDSVPWKDCKKFAGKTGLSVPTEAQWEFACRAGSQGLFAGTGELDDMGWYDDNSSGNVRRGGQKQPNAFGLYDMHGDVWEWCEDVYDEGFYSKPEALGREPVAVSGSVDRVIRGGGCLYPAVYCRSAVRVGVDPSNHVINIGFRAAFYPLPSGL